MIDFDALSKEFEKIEEDLKLAKKEEKKKCLIATGKQFREAIESGDDYTIGLLLQSLDFNRVYLK